ncbi:MAG: hypothetical protein PUH03_03220 [bacterium]|nr:hypothetical protein [bacterium]MDY2829860.1 hypothetical protein [Alphaproteobacteria bacterium]
MLFSKQPTPKNKKIAIIGTSPLAFYLSDTFIENGYNVKQIVPLNLLDNFTHSGAITVKSSLYKNHRQEFSFTSELKNDVDFCFLASAPENYRSDLLLLTNSFLKNIPLINLSSFYNHFLFNEQADYQEIPAFFKGWINFDGVTLQPLEKQSRLILECPIEKAVEIKKLFDDTPFNLIFAENNKNTFWQNLAAFFLTNLLLTSYSQSISKIFADKETRAIADKAIKELCFLAKKEKVFLEPSKILTDIYACPDEYKSEFSSAKGIHVLGQLIQNLTPFETPEVQNLLNTTVKKY